MMKTYGKIGKPSGEAEQFLALFAELVEFGGPLS